MKSSAHWLALYNETKDWKYWHNFCVMDAYEKLDIEKAVREYNEAEKELEDARAKLRDAEYALTCFQPEILQ